MPEPIAPANDNAAAPAAAPAPTLADKLQARAEALSKPDGAAPEAKPAEPAKPAEGAPKPESTDDLLAAVRAQRKEREAQKARDQELETLRQQLKDNEPTVAQTRQARELLARGDRIGAVRAMFPDLDTTGEFFYELARAVAAKEAKGEGEEPTGALTPAQVEELVEKRMAAKEAAQEASRKANETKAEQERRTAIAAHDAEIAPGFGETVVRTLGFGTDVPIEELTPVIDGYAQLAAEMGAVFDKEPAKYPALGVFKVQSDAIVAKHHELWLAARKEGKPGEISPEAVLQALEADVVARMRKTGLIPAAAEPKPTMTVTPAWRSDPGRPAAEEKKPETLKERIEARMAKLRASETST